MQSTRSAQRRSQRTRKQIATHAENDYYNCPRCKKLFPRYHGSHKRHIKSCVAKCNARAQEEAARQAEQVETPTPELYTPVLTDDERDDEGVSIGMWIFVKLMGLACNSFSLIHRWSHP